MLRPYRNLRVEEMRALFEARRTDPAYLAGLLQELAYRTTRASQALLVDVSLARQALFTDKEGADGEEADEDVEEGRGSTVGAGDSVPASDETTAERPVSQPAPSPASAGAASQGALFGPAQTLADPGADDAEAYPDVAPSPTARGSDREPQRRRGAQEPAGFEAPAAETRSDASAPAGSPVTEARGALPAAPPSRLLALQPDLVGDPYDSSAWDMESLGTDSLYPAADAEQHDVHLAACEWDIDPAILIHSAADIQARRHWVDVLEPFEHQVRNLITFCRRAPVALIADDVGLGKTISAGLVLSELLVRSKVHRALILVPRQVLLGQWKEELASKFHLRSVYATGAEFSEVLRGSVEIVITTYDSARNRMHAIAAAGFDMVVMDEAHRLRNLYGAASSPKIAQLMHKALSDRVFRYVLMLTATPIQNRLWDLYSLVDLLTAAKGHENPLGSPDQFVRRYVADGKTKARQLYPGRRDEFRRILSEYMVRTRRADANLEFPQRMVQLERAPPTDGERELLTLVGSFIGKLNALQQTSVAQAVMSSPQALVAQLENMAKRSAPMQRAHRASVRVVAGMRGTGKQKVLVRLLHTLQRERSDDWRVVIFTGRRETQTEIARFVSDAFGQECVGLIRGGDPARNAATIAKYSESPPRVHVVVSTDAGGEGLNLQAGNVLVNWDLPWNPMIMEQRIGRVQRLGSKHAHVVVLNLVLQGSVEERVVGRLAEKLLTIASTLGEIDGILESLEDGGDAGEALTQQIRAMVISSLKGMDVERSMRRMQDSIDRAKAIYEEEQHSVEQQLGKLDAMHTDGPRMPELSRVRPRMTERDFVLRALAADDGELVQVSEARWRYRRAGYAPTDVVFTREELQRRRESGFAGGPRVSLYLPGQPAFEKLGEAWRRRAHHAIRDLRRHDGEVLERVVEGWMQKVSSTVEVKTLSTREVAAGFQGSLTMRTAASVAHDKYEKLLTVNVATPDVQLPEDHTEWRAPLLDEPLHLDEVTAGGEALGTIALQAVDRDPDIGQFCTFYLKRLDEERRKAGDNRRLIALHEQSFTPKVSASLVGAQGALFGVYDVQVTFTVDNRGPFEVVLGVAPDAGQVIAAPVLEQCEVSGVRLPSTCLEACAITGRRAERGVLAQSERTGRYVLPEHAVQCQVTGQTLAEDEAGVSAVSGKVVDREMLVASELDGRLGLPEETARCAVTNALLLTDELVRSEVSGSQLRSDETCRGGRAQLIGHFSEFQTCAASGRKLLPDELIASDLSGKLVDVELAVVSERSGRRGLPEEARRCEVSSRQLLVDELGTCAVSGQEVDRVLVVESAASRTLALREKMVTCEVSGALLLPIEVEVCAVTGKIVDRRLLVESTVSGKLALRDAMSTCAISQSQALPGEMVVSNVSRRLALPSHAHRCAVTDSTALEDEMVRDDLRPGEWILAGSHGTSETSNRHGRPEDARRCDWDGKVRLADEVGQCALTGLRVGLEYLDTESRLRTIYDLLAVVQAGKTVLADTLPNLELTAIGRVQDLRDIRAVESPTGHCRACAGTSHRMFGLRKRRVAFVLGRDGQQHGTVATLD